jgi:hypothetical protein
MHQSPEAVETEETGLSPDRLDPSLVSMLDRSKISSPQAVVEPALLPQKIQTLALGSRHGATDKEAETEAVTHPFEDTELARRLPDIMIRRYDPSLQEADTALIRSLISQDLSEPYGIYVYRYFLFTWPTLTWLV